MATASWYGNTMLKVLDGQAFDCDGSTIKLMLYDNTYTPDIDTHIYLDDVSTYEITTGADYTGAVTLSCSAPSYDASNNRVVLDASNVLWSASTITASGAIIYVDTGLASTSLLLGYIDFGAEYSSVNGDFQITFDSTGVFHLSVV